MNTNEPNSEAAYAKKLASNRAWKAMNKERVSEYNKARNKAIHQDPALRTKKLESQKRTRAKNISKYRDYDRNRDRVKKNARSMVRNRIYRGTMERRPCEICGNPQSQAHHCDYLKPLDVSWLCQSHHAMEHSRK